MVDPSPANAQCSLRCIAHTPHQCPPTIAPVGPWVPAGASVPEPAGSPAADRAGSRAEATEQVCPCAAAHPPGPCCRPILWPTPHISVRPLSHILALRRTRPAPAAARPPPPQPRAGRTGRAASLLRWPTTSPSPCCPPRPTQLQPRGARAGLAAFPCMWLTPTPAAPTPSPAAGSYDSQPTTDQLHGTLPCQTGGILSAAQSLFQHAGLHHYSAVTRPAGHVSNHHGAIRVCVDAGSSSDAAYEKKSFVYTPPLVG